jgi:omega-amidase
MMIKISLAQMAFKFGEVEYNLNRVIDWVGEAAESGCDLILLPELWASGYDLENWSLYATSLDEGLFQKLAGLAKEKRIAIGGSLLEEKDGLAYNTFVLFGDNGEKLGIYRKIHRFRLLNEEKWLAAGDKLVMAKTPWGQVGLSICYDLRFPEMFRPFGISGAQMILIVAEWPERRIAHWSKLLQARAIENQIFVAGVNKVGESKGVKLGGHSAIIDPWGVPAIEGSDSEEQVMVEINLKDVEKARRHIPVFQDRRPTVYEGIVSTE